MGTRLRVIDNSGASVAGCIKIFNGYKPRFAKIGEEIIVSIKALRPTRKSSSKVKKGEKFKAVVVRTLKGQSYLCGSSVRFLDNSIILLNKKNKLLGTRIFGSLPKSFRSSKYLKLISVSSGVVY